jgi:hypothetical protein
MCASVLDTCVRIIYPIVIPKGSRATRIEISVFPNIRYFEAGIAQQVCKLRLRNAAHEGKQQACE